MAVINSKVSAIKEVIQNRRAIFPGTYRDEKIDKSIIEDILAQANYAPTHRLTEPWRFKVVQGRTRRKAWRAGRSFGSLVQRKYSK